MSGSSSNGGLAEGRGLDPLTEKRSLPDSKRRRHTYPVDPRSMEESGGLDPQAARAAPTRFQRVPARLSGALSNGWLREQDLNLRPPAHEAGELAWLLYPAKDGGIGAALATVPVHPR